MGSGLAQATRIGGSRRGEKRRHHHHSIVNLQQAHCILACTMAQRSISLRMAVGAALAQATRAGGAKKEGIIVYCQPATSITY